MIVFCLQIPYSWSNDKPGVLDCSFHTCPIPRCFLDLYDKNNPTDREMHKDAAVKAFGGSDATKREEEDLVAEYEAKLAVYDALMADLKAEGVIE